MLPVPRSVCRLIAPVAALTLGASTPEAQPLRAGVLLGRVLASSGGSVDRPVIRVSRAATIHLSEGEDDGDYRVEGLSVGRWLVSIRRDGFEPLVAEIEIPAGGLRRDFTLVEASDNLDSALVASGWNGVRGVVTDSRGNEALPGASLSLIGTDKTASSDSTGRFALALGGEKDFILRVGRTGYATRLVTGRTGATGYIAIDVPLDTTDEELTDYWIWRDLERRLKYATPRAVRLTRAEIAASGATSLGSALDASRSTAARGLIITTGACLFVDGHPRPGATVDAIRTEDVEFVEAYPEGADLTRTLASRWPGNAVCGMGSFAPQTTDPRRSAQWVVVWLRSP